MILVTGGLGFIGAHTVHALRELGAPCLATSHRARPPSERVAGAQIVTLDVTDRAAVLALGEREKIEAIVHLAAALSNPFDELRSSAAALANVLEAAARWNARACLASAIGVYNGVPAAYREDAALPLLGTPHPIVAMKKMAEVYGELAAAAGIDCVSARIGAIYGPGYTRGRTVPYQVARTAITKQPLDLSTVPWATAPDDGADWCHVRDCGRALALLATTPSLGHRVYNVGSGIATRNGDFAAIARRLAPDAPLADYAVSAAPPPVRALDIARLTADTGFGPRFTAELGMTDYVDWLASHLN